MRAISAAVPRAHRVRSKGERLGYVRAAAYCRPRRLAAPRPSGRCLRGRATAFHQRRHGWESLYGPAASPGDAPVPASMPSTKTTSAPALAASLTSSVTLPAPTLTYMGTRPSVASPELLQLDDQVVHPHPVGMAHRGCAGRCLAAGRVVGLSPRRPSGPAAGRPCRASPPCPITTSSASAMRRWSGSKP